MKIVPLAQEHVVLCESTDSENTYVYTPGLCRLNSGVLVATIDIAGPGAKQQWDKIFGSDYDTVEKHYGCVFLSMDDGKTWEEVAQFPFFHARPFVAGKSIYVLGKNSDLMIIRSDDNGRTWSDVAKLTSNQQWHQSACNVWYKDDYVYLVMEHRPYTDCDGWQVSTIAPVLLRGNIHDDLTLRENWTFASELVFRDAIDQNELNYFGVPFFKSPKKTYVEVSPGRHYAPMGWLETNVVQIIDPNHIWYDPTGHTFLLLSRAHTGGTGYCAVSKVVEKNDGTMETSLVKVPSGVTAAFLPMPGGQMRFHVLYDEQTKLYWLLSSQSTDSMTRCEALPPDRYNLPNNERHRLQLHFSKNCVDWCFAGLVAVGETVKQARHYASMIIDNDDLLVLSRSGNQQAKSAHDGNIITFHRIQNFRELVY